jgi:D-amino-acid oxidase
MYLAYLLDQVKANGVIINRATISHISEAVDLHHSGEKADLIVNCTGLLASKLGGVEDKSVYPVRGQLVVVRNEAACLFTTSGTDDGPYDTMYVQPRMGGKFYPS